MTPDEYRAAPGLSQSALKLFARDPLLYHDIYISKVESPPPETKSQKFGKRIEAFIRGDLGGQIHIVPRNLTSKNDTLTTNDAKAWRDEKVSAGADPALVMTRSQYEREYGCLDRVKKRIEEHTKAARLLLHKSGVWHHRSFWECPATGMGCKSELDRLFRGRKRIVDLKTTTDPRAGAKLVHQGEPTAIVEPGPFGKQCKKLGYGIQAAQYVEGMSIETDSRFEEWQYLVVAIRNKSPYDVWTYQIPPSWIQAGREWLHRQRSILQDAQRLDDWHPDGHDEILVLTEPEYIVRNSYDAHSFENSQGEW